MILVDNERTAADLSDLPKLVFLSADVRTPQKLGVTALMNRFCEQGYDVTLLSDTFGSHQLNFRCDHRLKRLSFDMGVKNCSLPAEVLCHFASQLPPSVFLLTDAGRADYPEFAAIIKVKSDAHQVIYLPDEQLPADLPEEAPERILAEAAQNSLPDLDEIKLPVPRRSLCNFIEKKFYYRERQRAAKQVPLQMSPEQVRKAQLLASKMLLAFERVCKKHGLRYYVAAGSLLGAARHGGPIPWDDDVDVTMPRPDYEAFIQIAQSELPEDMALPPDNFPYGFHRLQIRGTEITRAIRQRGPHGVFIDILPLDGAPPTQRQKKIHKLLNRILLNSMNAKVRPLPLITPDLGRVYECVKRVAIKCVPSKLLFRLWKRSATRYSTETAAEWVCLPGLYGYEKECFPKEYWGEPARLMYEGREVPVMREWEKYLVSHYGDYMTPTPVLERRTHPVLAIDFGKYEAMTIEEIREEVEAYGRNP